jgi:hypothetical protein
MARERENNVKLAQMADRCGLECLVPPLVGDSDHVAAKLAKISGCGFDGIIFGFVNYLQELPFFAQEILPRLERMGLRQPSIEGSGWTAATV